MGHDDERPDAVLTMMVNGEWVSVGRLRKISDRTVQLETLREGPDFTLMPATLTLHLRGMSRKRFVKQLMSMGISRNEAVATARRVRQELGLSYVMAFFEMVAFHHV